MSMDDPVDRCHLSGSIFPGEFGRFCQVTALVCFHSSASWLYEWNKGRNLSVSPPFQLGPPSIWKIGLQPEGQRVLGIRPPWAQSCQGRMWMTPTWIQPLKTESHVQTQMRCPYKLPVSTGRGYRLPVDWAKAVSGWRLNWKGSSTFARMCGDTAIKVLEQSRIVLLWKTATPLRCKKWWSGLTNCSALLRLLTPQLTPESQRPKPVAGQKI